jgi:ribulose-phosphate 3-epimerase
MIEHPDRQVQEIAHAGADPITVHVKATPHLHYALGAIRRGGLRRRCGVSPGTPADTLAEVAHETLDLALCMSVDPGWGAQHFLPASMGKLERMRLALPAAGRSRWTEASTKSRSRRPREREPTCSSRARGC